MIYRLLISLPMLVCFFWSIFFLIRCIYSDEEPRLKGSIWLFYLAATILYFDHWMYFSGEIRIACEWSYGVVNLCVYPLYYMYLRALTRSKKTWEVPLLLLPALVALLLFPMGRFSGCKGTTAMFTVIRLCFMVQVIWVLVRGFRLLRHTTERFDNTYSDDRSRLLRPTHILLLLFTMTSIVSMVLNFMGRDYFAEDAPVVLPAAVMSVLLYGLGYVASHTVIPPDSVPEEMPVAETGSHEESTDLIHRIDTVMREQRLFTNANLTILDLANAVGSNRTYVSNSINRTYNISFSQYVARQRVAFAKTVLKDSTYTTDKAAIQDAVILSGFASDQTFYRVFKEQTSQTPAQFRNSRS